MAIRVEQCMFCGEEFEDNPTVGQFANHMMYQIEGGRCVCVTELEGILDSIAMTLADGDLAFVIDIVASLIQISGARAVLLAGNAILHFDKKHNGLGLTQPSYLLPSNGVWPDQAAMTYVQFDVFVSRYKALSVISSSEDKFRGPGYWDRIEGEGDNEQEMNGVREARLCGVLKAIALSDAFWHMAGTVLAVGEPVLGLIIELTCLSSTVSTIYCSAKEVKKVVDVVDALSDDFVSTVHRNMRRFGTPLHRAAGVLNPMYMTENGLWKGNTIDSGMIFFFKDIVNAIDWDDFADELSSYLTDGPLLGGTLSGYRHPAVWWHEHAHWMPTLARYALLIVSYPHAMNFMGEELPIERFVTAQMRIVRPYEGGVFNSNYGYSDSFEEFLDWIVEIDDDAELLPQFELLY